MMGVLRSNPPSAMMRNAIAQMMTGPITAQTNWRVRLSVNPSVSSRGAYLPCPNSIAVDREIVPPVMARIAISGTPTKSEMSGDCMIMSRMVITASQMLWVNAIGSSEKIESTMDRTVSSNRLLIPSSCA